MKTSRIPQYNDKGNSDLYRGTTIPDYKENEDGSSKFNELEQRYQRTGDQFFKNKGYQDYIGSSSEDKKNFTLILKFTMGCAIASGLITFVLTILNAYFPASKSLDGNINQFWDITKLLIAAIMGLLGGKNTSK